MPRKEIAPTRYMYEISSPPTSKEFVSLRLPLSDADIALLKAQFQGLQFARVEEEGK